MKNWKILTRRNDCSELQVQKVISMDKHKKGTYRAKCKMLVTGKKCKGFWNKQNSTKDKIRHNSFINISLK